MQKTLSILLFKQSPPAFSKAVREQVWCSLQTCCAASFGGAILAHSHRTRVPRDTAEPQGLKLEQEFRQATAHMLFLHVSVNGSALCWERAQLKTPVCWLCLTWPTWEISAQIRVQTILKPLLLHLQREEFRSEMEKKNLDVKWRRLLSLSSTWTNPEHRHIFINLSFPEKRWTIEHPSTGQTTVANTYRRTWSDHLESLKGIWVTCLVRSEITATSS